MTGGAVPASPALSATIAAALALAPTLAEASGTVIRRHFRQRFEVIDKADASPVTIADRDAESALRGLIERHFPAHGVVGEEHGTDRADAEFVWTIDPIDGTGLFISGIPLFGTLVALLHLGRPVFGLFDQPVMGERWIGAAGHPTVFNGTPVHTRSCEALSAATVFATTPDMFRGEDVARFERVRATSKRTRFGTDCYAYGLVALGFVDGVIEAMNKPWDYCAHVPIIEGAGGIVSDWQGAPLGLGSDGRVLACGDARLHAAMLELVR